MKKRFYYIFILLAFTLGAFTYNNTPVNGATKLSNKTLYLQKGASRKLTLKNSKGRLKWYSTNSKIAKVDKKGNVVAVKAGKAYIKVRNRSKVYSCKVQVVSLSRKLVTLSKGQKFQIKVNNGKNSAWTSSDKSVATVDSKGKVTALKSGRTTISCKSHNVKLKCTIYVSSLNKNAGRVAINSMVALEALNTGHKCYWSSSASSVASVTSDGIVNVKQVGNAVITCKTGDTALTYNLEAVNPKNLYTLSSTLPTNTYVDDLTVSITSYPSNKTYTIHRQNAKHNLSTTFSGYMPKHGCSVSSLTCVLNAYSSYTGNPVYTVENVEKKIFGTESWTKNYIEKDDVTTARMPVSLNGMTKILDYYKVPNRYVRSFTDQEAITEITKHLKTGNPVIFVVSAYDRSKSGSSSKTEKWTTGYHCMTMLGLTETGKVIIADTVNRSKTTFGNNQRIKYATVTELVNYMFSCTKTSNSNYWSGKTSSGGYILINPQN